MLLKIIQRSRVTQGCARTRSDFVGFIFFFIFALKLRLECYTSVIMLHIALLTAKKLQKKNLLTT